MRLRYLLFIALSAAAGMSILQSSMQAAAPSRVSHVMNAFNSGAETNPFFCRKPASVSCAAL
jgi:hypothetical protein